MNPYHIATSSSGAHISSHTLNEKLKNYLEEFLETLNEFINVSIWIGKDFAKESCCQKCLSDYTYMTHQPCKLIFKGMGSNPLLILLHQYWGLLSWMKRKLVSNVTSFVQSLYLSTSVSKLSLYLVATYCGHKIFCFSQRWSHSRKCYFFRDYTIRKPQLVGVNKPSPSDSCHSWIHFLPMEMWNIRDNAAFIICI